MEAIIRPSADLRNHYSELSRQCREERTPIIITVNGRGDTALRPSGLLSNEIGIGTVKNSV